MPWAMLVFMTLVFAIPATQIFLQRIKLQRLRAEWASVADALGLEVTERAPQLALSGVIDGVEVEVRQTVVYPYKQAPIYRFIVRACVGTLELPDPSYRASVASMLRRDALLVDVELVDGWLEHRRTAEVFPHELEPILTSLTSMARVRAEENARRDEDGSSES